MIAVTGIATFCLVFEISLAFQAKSKTKKKRKSKQKQTHKSWQSKIEHTNPSKVERNPSKILKSLEMKSWASSHMSSAARRDAMRCGLMWCDV